MDQRTVTYRQHLTREIQISRRTLLGVVIMTVINIACLLSNSGTYLLFSISVPYYLTWFGKGMDNGFGVTWELSGENTLIGLAIAAGILLVYLLFWLMSAKNSGWLTAAVVCLCVDLAALIAVSLLLSAGLTGCLVDGIFHIVAIWQIGKGVSADRKRRDLPPEQNYTVVGPDL